MPFPNNPFFLALLICLNAHTSLDTLISKSRTEWPRENRRTVLFVVKELIVLISENESRGVTIRTQVFGKIAFWSSCICVALLIVICPAVFAGSRIAKSINNSGPSITISFDDLALSQLLQIKSATQVDPTALNLWLGLPANQYLLRIGELEGNLTPEQLRSNVLGSVATVGSEGLFEMGNVGISDIARYQSMLEQLRGTYASRSLSIAKYVGTFSPKSTNIKCTVFLHLGGDWDAVNDNGNIYINARFWLDNPTQVWDGIDLVVAHELMHTVQNQAYGNPERQDSSIPAFVTALSKIQREGTARYVEYEADPLPYTRDSYGFEYRAIDSEQKRGFAGDIVLLDALYDSCFPNFDHDAFGLAFENGVSNGGPYYNIGYGIASVIDQYDGRKELIKTVTDGPKRFFNDYAKLTRKHSKLPKLSKNIVSKLMSIPAKV